MCCRKFKYVPQFILKWWISPCEEKKNPRLSFNPFQPWPGHSCPFEGRIQHRIAAREGSGMGGCRLGGSIGAAALNDDDGLGQGTLPRRGEEVPGIADGLHVEHDAFGGRVLCQVEDHTAEVHIPTWNRC